MDHHSVPAFSHTQVSSILGALFMRLAVNDCCSSSPFFILLPVEQLAPDSLTAKASGSIKMNDKNKEKSSDVKQQMLKTLTLLLFFKVQERFQTRLICIVVLKICVCTD
ncbi:hypothetical protein [Niallia sp. BSM11]|uniref:hypothetical protein n=1 Tax=Niallia sp. BSM11 TaxID=3391576 RepID=UPI003984A858